MPCTPDFAEDAEPGKPVLCVFVPDWWKASSPLSQACWVTKLVNVESTSSENVLATSRATRSLAVHLVSMVLRLKRALSTFSGIWV